MDTTGINPRDKHTLKRGIVSNLWAVSSTEGKKTEVSLKHQAKEKIKTQEKPDQKSLDEYIKV